MICSVTSTVQGRNIQAIIDMVCYDIFVKCCHPVAEVQYTFTHKQYTERYKTNNT